MHKQQIKQASVYSFNKYLLSIRACARAPCWALGTWRRVISFLSPGSYRPGGAGCPSGYKHSQRNGTDTAWRTTKMAYYPEESDSAAEADGE